MTYAIVCLLPIVALIATSVIAAALRGTARRLTLVLAPFLIGCAMWRWGTAFDAGVEWLPELFRMATHGLAYAMIVVHYALLVAAALGARIRRAKQAS